MSTGRWIAVGSLLTGVRPVSGKALCFRGLVPVPNSSHQAALAVTFVVSWRQIIAPQVCGRHFR
jgi:hypothetical protein